MKHRQQGRIYAVVLLASSGVVVLFLLLHGGLRRSEAAPADLLAELANQVQRLAETHERDTKAVMQKLDQVLANQAKILEELHVVKVRATVR